MFMAKSTQHSVHDDLYLCLYHSVLLLDLCHDQHDLLKLLVDHVQAFEQILKGHQAQQQ